MVVFEHSVGVHPPCSRRLLMPHIVWCVWLCQRIAHDSLLHVGVHAVRVQTRQPHVCLAVPVQWPLESNDQPW